MQISTNNANIESKDADYREPKGYTPDGITQTNIKQELSGIIYSVSINTTDAGRKETTLVFDAQSEERIRIHEANKLMANWLTR